MNEAPTNDAVGFYQLLITDHEGRALTDIWEWDDRKLEAVHDYIQWLFPLREPSQFNHNAPVLDQESVVFFRNNPLLKARLRRSFQHMCKFYGLQNNEEQGDDLSVKRADDFISKSENWLRKGNHNHLRITRILTSTMILGLDQESRALLHCLRAICVEHPESISKETKNFWEKAVLAQ